MSSLACRTDCPSALLLQNDLPICLLKSKRGCRPRQSLFYTRFLSTQNRPGLLVLLLLGLLLFVFLAILCLLFIIEEIIEVIVEIII